MAAIPILGALFWVMVGLEAVYLWWLPPERPTRAARPLPSLVRGAIWAGFGGRGRPRLDAQIPFLIPLVLASANPELTRQHTLPFLVSRNALPRMSQLEFTARSIALTTWALRGRRIALERMHEAGVIDEIAFRQAMAAPMLVAPACDRPPEAETHRSPPAAPCYR
jgi:hypothetical protein